MRGGRRGVLALMAATMAGGLVVGAVGGAVVGAVVGVVVGPVTGGGRGADVHRAAERAALPPRTFSLVAFGDWLPEYRVLAAAAETAVPPARFDHGPLLEPLTGLVRSADLAICHMETPIGVPGAAAGFVGRAANRRSLIAAPYELAADLRRAGFDRCSTASNHSYDLGDAGIASTLTALDAAGITHDGTARSAGEGGVHVFEVNRVRTTHLSYALNTNTSWPSASWGLRRATGADAVRRDVAEARRLGAEVVVVSLHAYVEMAPSPARDDRALVDAITAGGAVDVVLVHGPHVVQPLEVVNGTSVFWSLGNHASGMGVPGRDRFSDPRTLDGLAAAVRFTERPDGIGFDVEATPVLICQMVDSRVIHPATESLRRRDVSAGDRSQIEACVGRSRPVVPNLR